MLHANAKALMRKKKYKEALEVLTMGEVIANLFLAIPHVYINIWLNAHTEVGSLLQEAFSLCDQKLIEVSFLPKIEYLLV